MLLVDADDAPSRRGSNYAGDDMVGGLGRRGVPRLKLYGFHSKQQQRQRGRQQQQRQQRPRRCARPCAALPLCSARGERHACLTVVL